MSRLAALALALALAAFIASSPTLAGDGYLEALRDGARAQERQANSLRRRESIERDRSRAADRARHNAERDSRSMRRFD